MRQRKPMLIMLAVLGVLFGAIIAYKVFIAVMTQRFIANKFGNITVSVSAMKVARSQWQPTIRASGSLRSVAGVDVTTSLAGLVDSINFVQGSNVNKGAKLVQLNADAEIGQLQSYQAQAALAKLTYERDKAQYAINAISKQQMQADEQNLKSLLGQVAMQTSIVSKKTITAPFSGRVGITKIDVGQYLNPGDKIVSLQTLDPIYVDFFVPQKDISKIKNGQKVILTTDSFGEKTFLGKITTIDSAVDTATRNIEVEATIANPKMQLTPGMFASVQVDVGTTQDLLTIPQTAVSYNPYGDLVYIIKNEGKDKDGKDMLVAHQTFVTLGDTRGDQVAVLEGLKEGNVIVTSGQLKLKNGSRVAVNNAVMPANNPDPDLPNDY